MTVVQRFSDANSFNFERSPAYCWSVDKECVVCKVGDVVLLERSELKNLCEVESITDVDELTVRITVKLVE